MASPVLGLAPPDAAARRHSAVIEFRNDSVIRKGDQRFFFLLLSVSKSMSSTKKPKPLPMIQKMGSHFPIFRPSLNKKAG